MEEEKGIVDVEDRKLVDIDTLQTARLILDWANKVPIDKIKWMKEGEEVVFSKEEVDKFKESGLDNVQFIFSDWTDDGRMANFVNYYNSIVENFSV